MFKNSKLFNILLILVYTFVCSGICVVASSNTIETGIECNLTEGKLLSVRGNGEAGENVTINILAPGKTYDDVKKDSSALIYHNQDIVAENGKYSFKAELTAQGEYSIYVKVGNKEAEKATFYYDGIIHNPVIFSADFEDRTLEGYGFSVLGNSGAIGNIALKDSEHGKSMNLKNADLCKVFDNKIEDKCIVINFSYLKESADNLFLLKLASDLLSGTESLKGTGGRMVFETVFDQNGEASFYNNMSGYTKPEDKSNYVEAPVGEWNRVAIYLDYLHSQIIYVINGNIAGKEQINNMAYNVKALCWSVASGDGVWIDDICIREVTRAEKLEIPQEEIPEEISTYSNRPVDIISNSGKTGNIFNGSDEILWDIEISDREQLEGNYSSEYVVKDEYGKTVWSATDSFYIEAGGKYNKTISLPDLSYGLYSFNVNVTSDNHEGYESFDEFSVVNSPSPEFGNDKFGYSLHVGFGREYEELLSLIDMSGAKIVRDELYWDSVENPLGVWNFPEHQVAYWQALSDKGITLLFGLNWGAPSDLSASWGTPQYNQAYANWAAKMAEKFKELGLNFAIETSNEWNSISGRTPEQYAALLKATYDAVKAVDENIMVVGGNYAGAPVDITKTVIDTLNGEKCMDAISIHIYEHRDPLGPETGGWISATEPMRELLDSYDNYKDVPIWLTETGWSTQDGWATDREQGALLARLAGMNDAKDLWDVVIWYNFQDDGIKSNERESNFGMTEFFWPSWEHPTPYAAKPAYLAMSNYNTLIGEAECTGEVDCGEDTYLYTYKTKDNKTLMMTGTVSGKKTLSLNVGSDSNVSVYDLYGNVKSLDTVNGIISLAISEEPIYIKGDFDMAELSDSLFVINTTEVRVVPGKQAEFILSKSIEKDVRVEIEADDKITLNSQPEFVSNEAKVMINTQPSLSGTEKVTLNIYSENDILLFTIDVKLVFIENEFDVMEVLLYDKDETKLDSTQEVPTTVNKAVIKFNPMPDEETIAAITVTADDINVDYEKTVDLENKTVELVFSDDFEADSECEIVIPEYIVRTENGNKNISYMYTFDIYDNAGEQIVFYSDFDNDRMGWDYHTQSNIVDISSKSFGENYKTAHSPHQHHNQYFYKYINTNQAVKKGEGQIIISFDRYQTTADGMKLLLSLFTDKNFESWEHVLYQSDAGQIGFSNYRQNKPGLYTKLTDVVANTNDNWTHYDVVIDLVNNYEYVYIDGVQVGKRYRTWLQSSTIYGIRFETHRSATVDSSYEGYVDNFVVSYAGKNTTDFCADVKASYGKVDFVLGERLPNAHNITSADFEIYEAQSGKKLVIDNVVDIDGKILHIVSDEITYGTEYVLKVNKSVKSMFGRNLKINEYSFSIPYVSGAGYVSEVTFTDSKDTHFAKETVCTDLSKITVQLSDDVSVPTFGYISFMQGATDVDVTEKYDPINNIYILEFEDDLIALQNYSLTVPRAVKAVNGEAFAQDAVYRFKAIPFRFGELTLKNASNENPAYVDGSSVTAQIDVEKLKEDRNAELIVAVYKDGRLIDIKRDSTEALEAALSVTSETIENTGDGAYEIKVFVWDNQQSPYILKTLNEQ